MSVIHEMCLYLNPPLLGKDYKSLAGKMGVKFLYAQNLAQERNPTEALLQHWWSSNAACTVTDLIQLIRSIDRNDIKCLLEKYEFEG